MVQLHYTNTIQMIQNLFQTIYLTRILDTLTESDAVLNHAKHKVAIPQRSLRS